MNGKFLVNVIDENERSLIWAIFFFIALLVSTNARNEKSNSFTFSPASFRIGRSGRFGRKGVAINFVKSDDIRILRDIEQYYATQIDEMPMNGLSYYLLSFSITFPKYLYDSIPSCWGCQIYHKIWIKFFLENVKLNHYWQNIWMVFQWQTWSNQLEGKNQEEDLILAQQIPFTTDGVKFWHLLYVVIQNFIMASLATFINHELHAIYNVYFMPMLSWHVHKKSGFLFYTCMPERK